jgi:hypothetical protein
VYFPRCVFFVYHFAVSEILRNFAAVNKYVRIMTAVQMNAELFRQLSFIAEDESLMAKVVSFVKGLVMAQHKEVNGTTRAGWAAAAKQAHAAGEDKLIVADVFEDETMEDWKW